MYNQKKKEIKSTIFFFFFVFFEQNNLHKIRLEAFRKAVVHANKTQQRLITLN